MKLKRILETSSAWKRFDALQKLRGDGMDIESGHKNKITEYKNKCQKT